MADPHFIEGLTYSLGPVIMEALEEQDMVEVMVNPYGNIWVKKQGKGMKIAGILGHHQVREVVTLMASSAESYVYEDILIVKGELPLADGFKFRGVRGAFPWDCGIPVFFTIFKSEKSVLWKILPPFLIQ